MYIKCVHCGSLCCLGLSKRDFVIVNSDNTLNCTLLVRCPHCKTNNIVSLESKITKMNIQEDTLEC